MTTCFVVTDTKTNKILGLFNTSVQATKSLNFSYHNSNVVLTSKVEHPHKFVYEFSDGKSYTIEIHPIFDEVVHL